MALAEYSLRIQHGIAGGFAPTLPESIHTLTKSKWNPIVRIDASIRPIGTPNLQQAPAKSLWASEVDASLVNELYSILKVLPTADQDIYGLDTSISFNTGHFWWRNSGSGSRGCGGEEGTVYATKEQKLKFKRAVAIANELVGKEE